MLPRASLFRAFINTARTNPRTRTRPKPRMTDPTPRLYSTTRPHYQVMAAATDSQAAVEADASGVTPESITATLKSKLDASHIEIEDMSGGCGQAFNAIIVSPQFASKTLLARHRLVNSALKAEIAAIHAWTPKCYTPEQWEKEKEKEKEKEQEQEKTR